MIGRQVQIDGCEVKVDCRDAGRCRFIARQHKIIRRRVQLDRELGSGRWKISFRLMGSQVQVDRKSMIR